MAAYAEHGLRVGDFSLNIIVFMSDLIWWSRANVYGSPNGIQQISNCIQKFGCLRSGFIRQSSIA
jgi:hypothetical protein